MEAETVMPDKELHGSGGSAFAHSTLSGATASKWIEEMVKGGSLAVGKVLVPSAEMADEILTLARLGFHVTVVDGDRDRVKRLKDRARGENAKLYIVTEDLFRTRAPLYGTVDLVIDRTLFPSLDPVQRADWSFAVGRLLHSNGRFLGLFPISRDRSGPPYSISAEELRKSLERLFVTELLEPAGATMPGETRGWKGLFRRK